MIPSAIVIEPFHISSGFQLANMLLHLEVDSLRMQWHVDETILKDIGMYKDFFLVTGDCEDKILAHRLHWHQIRCSD